MGADCSPPCRQARGPRTTGGRQPALPRSRAPDRPHGCAPARSFRPVRAWNSVFRRVRRRTLKGVFERLFEALSGDPDFEDAIIDGTIVRVHQHGTGAKGGQIRPLALIPSLPKVARRPDRQDRRHGRRAWQFRRLRCSARPAPRQRRRHGLRQQLAARRTRSARRQRRHPAESRPCPPDFRRFRHLQKASPKGVVSSNTSSAIVPSSGASPPATKKPTQATQP
jgi:hypothetical protein